MDRHIEEYQQDANMSAVAYESAVEIKDKSTKIATMLSNLDKHIHEDYGKVLDLIESLKDDIAEIDVYNEFENIKTCLATIEDCSACISEYLDVAWDNANKIIEEM